MPTATKDDSTLVEVRYIPIADNYKGAPLTASYGNQQIGNKQYKLQPGVPTKIPVALARQLQQRIKRSMRGVMAPDGRGLEERMLGNDPDIGDGVRGRMMQVLNTPDFELVVKGEV